MFIKTKFNGNYINSADFIALRLHKDIIIAKSKKIVTDFTVVKRKNCVKDRKNNKNKS